MSDRRLRFEAQALPHLDAALNLARWLTRSRADADDVVQEAMLRAFRAFDGVRGSDVKPWLLTIVRNCCMTWTSGERRRARNVQPIDETIASKDNLLAVPLPDPETAAIGADEGQKLAALVQALPEDFRTVLILREWEDLSYKEIAEVTGMPIGTVMSRLARARALLKDAWFDRVEGGARHAVR
jgi:RNA polymerase sigma-70 factor (ECF subfamily)